MAPSAQAMSEQSVTGAVKLTGGAIASLQRQKRAQRINNEKYFRTHPELRQMVSAFISALLTDKPRSADVRATSDCHRAASRRAARR